MSEALLESFNDSYVRYRGSEVASGVFGTLSCFGGLSAGFRGVFRDSGGSQRRYRDV